MELSDLIDPLTGQALTVGLAAIRVSVAFILLPLFSEQLIPPLIRNAIFLALAVIVVLLHPAVDVESLSPVLWLRLIGKEVLLGVSLGVFFGFFLWAFEAAGQIIDSQIGMNMAQIFDPLEGHETSLIGSFMGRFMNYAFVALGGLMFFVGLVMQSYATWPIDQHLPQLEWSSLELFKGEVSELFGLMLIVAGPALVLAFMIDVCMGLINRESQQFNVFFLSMPLKTLATVFVLVLSLGFLVDLMVLKITESNSDTFNKIHRLIDGKPTP